VLDFMVAFGSGGMSRCWVIFVSLVCFVDAKEKKKKKKKTLIEESVDVIRRRESERKERKLVAFFEESADFTCQFLAFKNHEWFTLIKLLVTMNQLTFFLSFLNNKR